MIRAGFFASTSSFGEEFCKTPNLKKLNSRNYKKTAAMNALKMDLMELIQRRPDEQVPRALNYFRRSAGATDGQRLTNEEALSWFDKATKGPRNVTRAITPTK